MNTQKVFLVANVSLAFISVLLVLNLFDVTLPSVGRTLSALDPDEPECVVQWRGQQTKWADLDRCCLEARSQLECVPEDSGWNCRTGDLQYKLNNKGYHYCRQQPFW